MGYYERALALMQETVAHRRYLHKNAEVGLHMPKARAYIVKTLRECGLEPEECGCGVSATIGSGKLCILLRADMDALPMAEESGEPFACPTGTEAHTCGHDVHAAMLLTAAKMLKENEKSLRGRVRLMFQPAEETLLGCQNMIDSGILRDVDAALAYHITAGTSQVGCYLYNDTGTMMFSSNGFKITIRGRGGHGAYPHHTIDPITIGAHIHLTLQSLIAREGDPSKSNILTIGQFSAGTTANIIPEEAVLQGSLRTDAPEEQKKLLRRLEEVVHGTAGTFGGRAEVEILSDVPPLICCAQLTREVSGYMSELPIPGLRGQGGIVASASDDFAKITSQVPGVYMYLAAGYTDGRAVFGAHHPKVQFNEDVCPVGAACLAHCASRYLEARF